MTNKSWNYLVWMSYSIVTVDVSLEISFIGNYCNVQLRLANKCSSYLCLTSDQSQPGSYRHASNVIQHSFTTDDKLPKWQWRLSMYLSLEAYQYYTFSMKLITPRTSMTLMLYLLVWSNSHFCVVICQ